MKRRYIILTFILSFLCLNRIYADCIQDRVDDFKKVQHKYKITTKYVDETKSYTMIVEEADNKKYAYSFGFNEIPECKKINETTMECYNIKPGTSFNAYIMNVDSQCKVLLKEELIEFTKLNEYRNDPLCEGIEDFVLCQPIYDKEIDRETFESRVEIYKKSKQEKIEEEIIKKEKEQTDFKEIKEYIQNNLVQIIIVIIFVILTTISLIIGINQMKKSRRLE